MHILCKYKKNSCHGGVPCFELVSSHQQGIHITCLAHDPALHAQDEPCVAVLRHVHVHYTAVGKMTPVYILIENAGDKLKT